MGRDKALIELDGEPLVERSRRALIEAGATSVSIVGGDHDRLGALGLTVIDDDEPGSGPVGAVATALGADPDGQGGCDLVVVLACDLAEPSPAAITATVEALDGDSHAGLACPELDGIPQWLHACWRTSVALQPLRTALAEGHRSFRSAVGAMHRVVVTVDPGALEDLDTPETLRNRRPGTPRC